MTLELNFNDKYETLDLIGRLTAGAKRKVTRLMTYNPTLRCYQGSVTLQVLKLAYDLHATISPDVLEAFQESTDSVRKDTEREDISASNPESEKLMEAGPIGFIVKHASFGLGRLLNFEDRVVTVNFFFPPARHQLTRNAISRALIPISTHCKTENGNCIIKAHKLGLDHAPNTYQVEFENGLSGELLETQLIPIKFVKSHNPLEILSTLQHEGYPIFADREQLQQLYNEIVRQGVGVKSLLASRIDLYPHQAYVAGTVILDNRQRYLLADEVGLGKTIEAGIVIHDLLSRKPHAKILILCPGSLVQQWFSEMYSKFSGVIFRLPELSGCVSLGKDRTKQIILSFHAALASQGELVGQQWDLVVVDEVHNLLRVQVLYELVKALSLQDCGLLLLSALPAQHRDQEYFDLLALLDPQKYNRDDPKSHHKFSKLFDRQREIGGRIGVVKRRLLELQTEGTGQRARVIKQLAVLMDMPVLKEDQFLNGLVDNLDSTSDSFLESVHKIIYHISDYYRINRRILRNRREKLIKSEQITRIKRDSYVISYPPDQYEIDALSALDNLLLTMHEVGLREEILFPLSTQLLQSSTHPETLLQTLRMSDQTFQSGKLYEKLHDLVSYAEWDGELEYFWTNAREVIDHNLLQDSIRAAGEWQSQGDKENFRLKETISLLNKKHRDHPEDKFVLFAGYPTLASILVQQLSDQLGKDVIAQFYYGMHSDLVLEQDLKEKEVRRFRNDQQTWLLICDETGGEGRNFQFAAELIHYDLPWQAAKIEQRIGRLDRLGRKRSDVLSNLLFAKGSKEEAWFNCLSDGLGIFDQSISGLEFALRDIESSVIRNLLSDDDQALWDMPPHIRERVIAERALDESQNQIDEASYERVRAEEFRRVQSNGKQDRELENRYIQYFKMISDKGGFKFPYQVDYPEGVVEFHPEDVRQVKLDMPDIKKTRTGTFRREIAQNRPDLEFFSIGNDFFDSVCRSLFTDPTGRTYAVECNTLRYPTWRGFEFSYRLKVNSTLVPGGLGLQNLLDYIFAERIEHSFVNEDGELSESTVDLLKLRRSFNNSNKRQIWKNITKNSAIFLSNFYPNWEKLIRDTEKISREHIRGRYSHILAPKIDDQFAKLTEQIKKLESAKPDGWEDKIKSLNHILEAINTWDIELDAVGFLSINGGLCNV